MLGFHCAGEFLLNNKAVLDALEDGITRQKWTIAECALGGRHSDPMTSKEIKFLLEDLTDKIHYMSHSDRIPQDLCLRNIIQSCIDFKKP